MSDVFAIVLGTMQDAGLPHIGCRRRRCQAGSAHAACLGVVDARQVPPAVWLIDATPDIKHQLALLAEWLGPHPTRSERLRQPDGIFLTHAHMGHTAGLPQLGPEGMFVQNMPLYASAALLEMVRAMPLWRPLVDQLDLRPLLPGSPLPLAPDLVLTPVPVLHRDEVGSGTFGFHIQGSGRTLLYVPDIDDWGRWSEAELWLARSDIILADATFFSPDELGGRPPVAHPLIPDTLAFFAHHAGELWLTHLNHTNAALDAASSAYQTVRDAGCDVVSLGQRFLL